MTHKEALVEAQRRWGPDAWVGRGKYSVHRHDMVETRYDTVFKVTGLRPNQCGMGRTWEAAFADADRQEKRE